MSKAKKEKKRTTQSYYREVVMIPDGIRHADQIGPLTINCGASEVVYVEIGSKRIYIDASCDDVYVAVEGAIGEAFIGSDSGEGEDK